MIYAPNYFIKPTLFKMPLKTITKVFIPRVLANVTISQIHSVFASKQIGKTIYVDMHRRKNENNRIYSFVFLDISLYDTKESCDFYEDMTRHGSCKLYYDKKNYWEVKPFAHTPERGEINEKKEESDKPEEIENIYSICKDLAKNNFDYDYEKNWKKIAIHSELLKVFCDREINVNNHEKDNSKKCQSTLETRIFREKRLDTRMEEDQLFEKIVIDDFSGTCGEQPFSKFIPMFNELNEQERTQLTYIRTLCNELMKLPSFYTKEEREKMEKDYDDLEKEIKNAHI